MYHQMRWDLRTRGIAPRIGCGALEGHAVPIMYAAMAIWAWRWADESSIAPDDA